MSIAYQVVGDGSIDLVMCPGEISHLEFMWTNPTLSRNVLRLASFARVIRFDKRGTGMSDRDTGIPTLEERIDDVRAVMDAAGSERAVIYGISEGGAMSALFAAMYPHRTIGLILYGAFPRILDAPDWPGIPREMWDAGIEHSVAHFGEGSPLERWAPSVAGNREIQEWWGTSQRMGASPSALRALLTMNRDIDVRAVLPTIQVPTLVRHRVGDRVVPIAAGEYTKRPPIGCSRRSCSPTSSIQLTWPSASATRSGGVCSTVTTMPRSAWQRGIEAAWSRAPVTACSRASTVPPGPPASLSSSAETSRLSGCGCAPGYTQARSKSAATTLAASPYTSRPGSLPSPGPTRFSQAGRCEISRLERASCSKTAVRTSSRACPTSGRSTQSPVEARSSRRFCEQARSNGADGTMRD